MSEKGVGVVMVNCTSDEGCRPRASIRSDEFLFKADGDGNPERPEGVEQSFLSTFLLGEPRPLTHRPVPSAAPCPCGTTAARASAYTAAMSASLRAASAPTHATLPAGSPSSENPRSCKASPESSKSA